MLRRAAALPLPDVFARRLGTPLDRIDESVGAFLRGSAAALAERRIPPPLDPVEASLEAYDSEVASLRGEGLTRALSTAGIERLFAIGFALGQLRQNLTDLVRRVQEFAGGRVRFR